MTSASQLAAEAWKLAESGQPEEAIARYRQALASADSSTFDLWRIRGEFAAILARSGDLEGAAAQYELSLKESISRGEPRESSVLAITRYFLAELQLALGQASTALATIAGSLSAGTNQEALLRMVEAQACEALGDHAKAKVSAELAITESRTPQQRERIVERLANIVSAEGPPNSR